MIKVAFLNPNIPPRVVSLLNKINSDKEINIKGFFFSVSQKNRHWQINSKEYEKIKFPYKILQSSSIGFGIRDYHNSFISFDLYKELSKYDPDIVLLPGWADLSSYIAIIWARINKKKIILRTESTEFEKSFRRTIFMPLTKIVCNSSDLIIACSNRAHQYAKSISNNRNITKIYSSFDTVKFNKKVLKVNKRKIKKDLSIKQKKIVYFNGQIIERKGILPLLKSFTKKDMSKIALVLTGKGKLDSKVKAIADKSDNIYFFGYQKQTVLPNFYAIADFFILPSYEETWGLVTIEAMASGLPVIISRYAGSSELIKNTNGIILPEINSKTITNALQKIKKIKKNDYQKISNNNLKMAINLLSYEKISQQFINSFRSLY